jgi:hypothetical protein
VAWNKYNEKWNMVWIKHVVELNREWNKIIGK